MNLAELSVKRPVFVGCIVVLVLVLGVLSIFTLGVDQFPDINYPVISVIVPYRGAAPEELESLVAKKIEDELSAIQGVKHLTTTCEENVAVIVCEFTLETNNQVAEQNVRDKMTFIRSQLPKDIDEPIIRRFDPSDQPVYVLAMAADLSETGKYNFANEVMKPRLSQIEGVGSIMLIGGTKREIHVLLDRNQLNSHQVSASMVAVRIATNSQNVPVGNVDRGPKELLFRAVGEYNDLDRIRRTVVNFVGSDVSVPVGKLGRVEDGSEELTNMGFVDGRDCVVLVVFKQRGANTVQVVDRVAAKVKALNQEYKDLPGKPQLTGMMETAWMIRMILGNVEESILLGILLTILVVYVFLGNVRNTLIVLSSLPVSLLGAFACMKLMGFTINTLTLMAVSLVVGLLVDDAIVVLENIWRHIEEGEKPRKAAVAGTQQVTLAVVATSLVIMAVFLPIGFLKGLVGQFFKEFGFTISFAMAVSLFVSLTLIPLLAAYIHKPDQGRGRGPEAPKRSGWLLRRSEAFQGWLGNKYVSVVRWCIRFRWAVVLLAVLVFAGSLGLLRYIPIDFMGRTEVGYFMVNLKAAPDINLKALMDSVNRMTGIITRHPEVSSVGGMAGAMELRGAGKNTATLLVRLVPPGKRAIRTSDFMTVLRKELAPYRESLQPQVLDFNPVNQMSPFSMNLKGADYKDLTDAAPPVMEKLRAVPGLADLTLNYDGGKPEFHVVFDPKKLEAAGVMGVEAGMELRTQVDGAVPAKFRENGLEYDIRVRLQEDQRDLQKDYKDILVPNQNHRLVHLTTVADPVTTLGPSSINRYNRTRYIQVSGQLAAGASLGDVLKEARKVMASMTLPKGVTYEFVGQAEDLNDMIGSVLWAMGLALFFMYLILASLYESPVIPLTILLAVPLAIVGALSALWVTGMPMDVNCMITLILLLGLVTKNSILLVDYILQARRRGLPREEAIVEAGRIRLRPILMTTLALVAGMLPLVMAFTEVGRFRQPTGVAQIGGLLSSLFLTLLVVPAAYGYIDDLRLWFRKLFRLPPETPEEKPEAKAAPAGEVG